jgi:hypothetical protein
MSDRFLDFNAVRPVSDDREGLSDHPEPAVRVGPAASCCNAQEYTLPSIYGSYQREGSMAKKKELTPLVDQDLKKYVAALCKQIAECVKRDDFTLARRQSNDLLVELAELEAQKRAAK